MIKYPVIDNDQLAKLRHVYDPGFRAIRLPMLFDASQGGHGLERALEDLKRRAHDAVEAGYTILILSDRDADRVRARSRACSRRPACTITWFARAAGRGARWSSNRATRAKCITARCCSATAPAR